MRLLPNACKKFIASNLIHASMLLLCCQAWGQVVSVMPVDSQSCISCDGSANASVSLPGLISYSWLDDFGTVIFQETNSVGTSSVQNLCPGFYEIIVDNGSGPQSTWFGVNSLQSSVLTYQDFQVCSQEIVFDLFTVLNPTDVTGIWLDPNGNITSSLLDPATALSGIYSYPIVENSCSFLSGINVDVVQQADPGLTTTYLICENYVPFEMTALLAGTPDLGGQWYGPGSIPFDGIFDSATMGTDLFVYQIDTVVGCPPIWTTMYVIENTIPNAGVSTEILVCPSANPFDMTSALGGSPDIGGQWFDVNNNVVSNVFDPTTNAPGVYTYQVDGQTPCPNLSSDLTVNFIPGLNAGVSAVAAICDAAPIDLTSLLGGSPTIDGEWVGPNGTVVSNPLDLSTAVSGTYVYTVSGMGCMPISSTLNLTLEIVPNAGPDQFIAVCESATSVDLNNYLTPEVSVAGQWYDSQSNAINSVISNLSVGTFMFTYQVDGILCPSDFSQFSLSVNPLPNAGNDLEFTFCETEPVFNPETVVPNYNGEIIWDKDGVPTSIPLFDPALELNSVFNVTFVSGNSCPDDLAQIVVHTELIPFNSGSLIDSLCSSVEQVDLNSFLGDVPSNIGSWWNASGTTVSNLVNPNLGSGPYSFVSTSQVVCPPSEIDVELLVEIQANPGTSMDFEVCHDQGILSLQLLLEGEDQEAGVWTFNGVELSPILNLGNSSNGIYTYTIPESGPCPSISSFVNLSVNQGVSFNAGVDVFACAGSTQIQIGEIPSANTSYSWQPELNLNDVTLANPTLSFVNNTNNVLVTDYVAFVSNGVCQEVDTVEVSIYPLPTLEMPDLQICEGVNQTLETGNLGIHTWGPSVMFPNPNISSPSIQFWNSTQISVLVENEFSCSSETTFFVEVLPRPAASFDVNPVEGCVPLTVEVMNLSVNAQDVTYFWELSTGETSTLESPIFTFLESGAHDIMLTAIGANGCETWMPAEAFITVHPKPFSSFVLEASSVSELNPVNRVQNMSVGGETMNWHLNGEYISSDFEPIVESTSDPLIENRLCLKVVNTFGCSDSTCHSFVVDGEFWVFAPNAFTPDQDGLNDVFLPVIHGADLSTYEMSIFDRWGELVFHSLDPTNPWLGSAMESGYFVPNGAYIWQLKVRSLYRAEWEVVKGHVSVMR